MTDENEMKRAGLRYYVTSHIKSQEPNAEGFAHALDLIKVYLRAEGIVLFKKNEAGKYEMFAKENIVNTNIATIANIIDTAAELIGKRDYLNIDFRGSQNSNLLLIPVKTKNNSYVLVVKNNLNKDKNDLFSFVELVQESLYTVLSNHEKEEKLEKSSLEDGLTELDNRASYNKKAEQLDNSSVPYTFVLLDLFRLKYVNDNISHVAGDIYIKETARILKKYFPKFKYVAGKDGIDEKQETGNCVYRIGGDEFAVIINTADMFEVETRIQLAAKEVESIDLKADEKPPLGLNYGIVVRENSEDIDTLKEKADKLLSNNKRDMYKALGLDRRK